MDAVPSYTSRIRERLTTNHLHAEGTLLLTGGTAIFSGLCFSLGYGILSVPNSWQRLAKVVDVLRQRTYLIGFIIGGTLGSSVGLCFGAKAIQETGTNERVSFRVYGVVALSHCMGMPMPKEAVEREVRIPHIPLLSTFFNRAELQDGSSMKKRLLHDLPRVAAWLLLFVGVSGGMVGLDIYLRNYSQGKIPWSTYAGLTMGGAASCNATFALLSLWPFFHKGGHGHRAHDSENGGL